MAGGKVRGTLGGGGACALGRGCRGAASVKVFGTTAGPRDRSPLWLAERGRRHFILSLTESAARSSGMRRDCSLREQPASREDDWQCEQGEAGRPSGSRLSGRAGRVSACTCGDQPGRAGGGLLDVPCSHLLRDAPRPHARAPSAAALASESKQRGGLRETEARATCPTQTPTLWLGLKVR